MHREYTRERTQQSRELEKRAQKSKKLEILRMAFTEIHSNKDLRKHMLCKVLLRQVVFESKV